MLFSEGYLDLTCLHVHRGATVLPSYGMTECMPITSPPPGYQLDRPGTSGKAVGPQLAIIDEKGAKLSIGVTGRIGVQGAPCFTGYDIDGVRKSIPPTDTEG